MITSGTNPPQQQSENPDLVVVLKARLYDSHCENEQLRRQLEQTRRELNQAQALLGQIVSTATSGAAPRSASTTQSADQSESKNGESLPIARPVEEQKKRPRSPSLEYVDWDPHAGASTSQVKPTEVRVLPDTSTNSAHGRKVQIIDLTLPEVDEVGNEASESLVSNPHTSKTVENPARGSNVVGQEQYTTIQLIKKQKTEHIDGHTSSPVEQIPHPIRNTAAQQVQPRTHRPARAVDQAHQNRIEGADRIAPDSQEQESRSTERYRAPAPVTSAMQNGATAQASSSSREGRAQSQMSSQTTVKTEASNLPADNVIAPFSINPPPVPIHVSRTFLRINYGGNEQAFLQFIPPERNPSGPRRRGMVFPNNELNPAMPRAPGAPGVVFCSRHEILQNGPWTVFCKQVNTSPVVWLYLGEYENTLLGRMTKEHFAALELSVQRAWARSLIECKQFDVYVAMRARIALRLSGSLPLPPVKMEDEDEELNGAETEEEMVKKEIDAIKKHHGRPVTIDDVVAALVNGDESIDIIQLRCVGYDNTFASHMRAKLTSYKKPGSARRKT